MEIDTGTTELLCSVKDGVALITLIWIVPRTPRSTNLP